MAEVGPLGELKKVEAAPTLQHLGAGCCQNWSNADTTFAAAAPEPERVEFA
jgi:hypothetical protein